MKFELLKDKDGTTGNFGDLIFPGEVLIEKLFFDRVIIFYGDIVQEKTGEKSSGVYKGMGTDGNSRGLFCSQCSFTCKNYNVILY